MQMRELEYWIVVANPFFIHSIKIESFFTQTSNATIISHPKMVRAYVCGEHTDTSPVQWPLKREGQK